MINKYSVETENYAADYRIEDNTAPMPDKKNKESKDYISAHRDVRNVQCILCPHYCVIKNNTSGKCGARKNIDGKLIAYNYGKVTSIALDPIEKKPLYHFHPGKMILSVGSFGCNFNCPFCQNYNISLDYDNIKTETIMPDELTDLAVRCTSKGNIGIAYTYNEPLIGFEYVRDCSAMIKEKGMMNVLVTNGYINEQPLKELLPFIDAMNIDIKGGAEKTYKTVGGTQKEVIRTITLAHSCCHIELTTLIVSGLNEGDIEEISRLIGSIDRKIPYHITRFFPKFKYANREPTDINTMYRLRDIASRHLDNVYMGNI